MNKCINHAPNLYKTYTMNKCINHAPNLYKACTMNKCINREPNLYKYPFTTTYTNNLSQEHVSSILSTKSYILTKINNQDKSQICASPKHNTTTHNHHQDQYVLLIIYQYKYATSSIKHVSTILLTSASNHVSSMYQSCINYSSTITHQDVPTSSTIHLMYVPTHQLLVSTMYPTCTSTKIPHQFHHPNMIFNFVIDLVYMITYLQRFLNFNNKRLAFSSNFTLVSHD
jgi:hypothetical protein